MTSTTTSHLPRPDRLRGVLSAAVGLAVTPLVPTDYLDLLAPLRSRANLRARIVDVIAETTDAATIVLRPGRGWQGHVPGQYVTVGVDVDGVRHWRAYSLTSAPQADDGCIRITVKAVDDGAVSTHLVRRAGRGEIVQLEQAAGDFLLPTPLPPRTLFVVAGSGVTPVMGMLRSHVDGLADVVVVHSASTIADAIFRDELTALAAAGRIRLVEQVTSRDGRLTAAALAELVPDLSERETFACGPAGLLDVMESHWDAAGLRDRLHVERFRPALLESGDGGTVSFAASGIDVDVDGGTTLLDAGERAGVLMPSGCRMGVCFGCVVPLRSGAVRDLRTGEITRAQDAPSSSRPPGAGRTRSSERDDDARSSSPTVQTCINTAASACQLDV